MKRILFFCLLLVSIIDTKAQCWKEVSAGVLSAGIKTDGTLWIWGSGVTYNGAIFVNSSVPVQLGTGTNWKTLSVGKNDDYLIAIQTNGTLWAIGDNRYGQLGNGTTIHSTILIQIGTATNWTSVSTGGSHTIALTTSGTLWSWGDNSYGQLGDGTQIDRNLPGQIGSDTDWQSISTSDYMGAAIKTNGTLWVWSSDLNGNLGLGSGPFATILPTQVGVATNWKSVSVGTTGHTLALKTNGTLWAWGFNANGALGDGTYMNKFTPIQIGTAIDWQAISSGFNHSVGLKTSGTLWTWGYNINGQLGNSTSVISTNVPGQVGIATNWQSISAGNVHSLAIKTDGSLWAWGANGNGLLGDGTTISKNYPVGSLFSAANVTASSTGVCAGSQATLTASGASTYTWTGGVTNGVPFIPASSGGYTVTGLDANGCYSTATVAIVVSPTTTVIANATATIICNGSPVTLTGSGSVVYSWSNGVIDGIPFTPTMTTVYTVADSTGCSNTASITVSVIPSPTVTVNSATICSGSNALLTASVNPSAGTIYSWSGGGTGNSLAVSPSTNASYTITATNTGCSASAVASVSVIPVNVPVTGFSYPTPICLTGSNPLPTGILGFTGGGAYASGAGITTDPVTGQIDLSNSSAGTYVVTYSVAASGCNPAGSSTASVSLNAPVAAVTGFSYLPVCSNGTDPAPLLNSGFTAGGNFSGPGLALNAGSGIINLSATAPGTYTVTYNVSAANCVLAGTGTAGVVINPAPVLSVSSSTLIYTGDQTTLTANSSANTYTWSPATGLSCSDCAMPVASLAESTIYCVRTTDGVCTNSACITVVVESFCEDDQGFFLPNAFSPNNDGNNDVFCVQGRNRCMSNFQMIIYNRWGEKVFESSDLSACWDGTYKDKVLSPDVFVYYIKAQDQQQQEIIKKGNVSLIK